jgi:hypothetical protein
MEGDSCVVEPEPVEAVVRVDPVGIDDLQAFALALERDLAVLAIATTSYSPRFRPSLAHIHPRLEHLAAPVGRGEAQFLAGDVGALER